MTTSRLPRLELTEDPNKKNEFIIFRHRIKGKKEPKGYSDSKKITSKKKLKHKRVKTRKHKKSKSLFNIF